VSWPHAWWQRGDQAFNRLQGYVKAAAGWKGRLCYLTEFRELCRSVLSAEGVYAAGIITDDTLRTLKSISHDASQPLPDRVLASFVRACLEEFKLPANKGGMLDEILRLDAKVVQHRDQAPSDALCGDLLVMHRGKAEKWSVQQFVNFYADTSASRIAAEKALMDHVFATIAKDLGHTGLSDRDPSSGSAVWDGKVVPSLESMLRVVGTACDHCKRPAGRDVKITLCGRCGMVGYCSSALASYHKGE
jgi:hypothetical protein